MGRRNKRTQKRDFRHPRANVWQQQTGKKAADGWTATGERHPDHEEYYKAQQIMEDSEWEDFVKVLSKQLPITFRINGSGKFADHLRQKLETNLLAEVLKEDTVMVDDEPLEPPKVLPWYPDRLAWQLSFSRHQLRRVDALAALHEFIKRETECGAITRQEAVSMVPPLFMDVQPHHKVLDMCAAPGSKTFQLLEMLHSGAGPGGPSGLVVANDADIQRCNMLTHQTKRMCSPALVVTNHNAQFFPLICPPALPEDAIPKEGELYQFDRILCDVPCSGDGTIRKAPDIWAAWGVHNGNGLHSLQIRITLQAVRLLHVGGRLVYSTCSLNPIEDEAVVAEVLRRSGGAMRLVDVSSQLPALKRRAGLTTWRVKDRSRWYDSWEEAKDVCYKLDPGMFPQPDIESMNLPLCMRLLPHDNDTGGFFVAVMEKVGPADILEFPTYDHRATRKKDLDSREAKREAKRKAEVVMAANEGEAGTEEQTAVDPPAEEATPAAAAEAAPAAAQERDGTGEAEAAEDVVAEEGGAGGTPESGAAVPATPSAANGTAPPPSDASRPKHGGRWHGIDPIFFITNEDIIQPIIDFYGLDPARFPIRTHLMTRSLENPTRPKRLYIVAPAVKALLKEDAKQKLRITCAGLKVFERQEPKEQKTQCSYRLVQEGVPLILPHVTRQLIKLGVHNFLRLISDRIVGIPYTPCATGQAKAGATDGAKAASTAGGAAEVPSDLPAGGDEGPTAGPTEVMQVDVAAVGTAGAPGSGPVAAAEGSAPAGGVTGGNGGAGKKQGGPNRPEIKHKLSDQEELELVRTTDVGCCICMIRDEDCERLGLVTGREAEGALTVAAPLAVATWRGNSSISVLVSKQECAQVAEKLKEALREAGEKVDEDDAPATATEPGAEDGQGEDIMEDDMNSAKRKEGASEAAAAEEQQVAKRAKEDVLA